MATVKPVTNGCVFIPGRRYMVNIETRVVFPYAKYMEDLAWMREYTPHFNVVKDDDFEDAIVFKEGDVETDIVIEDVVVDVKEKDITPAQKSKITRDNKKNSKVGV